MNIEKVFEVPLPVKPPLALGIDIHLTMAEAHWLSWSLANSTLEADGAFFLERLQAVLWRSK